MNQIQTNQCPRWDNCSANYCPIDGGNAHLRGEATCYYMREALKGVPADLFKGDGERLAYKKANDHNLKITLQFTCALFSWVTVSVGSLSRATIKM